MTDAKAATARPGESVSGLDAADAPGPVPGGPAADQGLRISGLPKLCSMQLSAKNVRFGAVVRNAHVAGIAVLELPFDAVAWNAALGEAVDGLAAAGAATAINGCLKARVVAPTALAPQLLPIGGSA